MVGTSTTLEQTKLVQYPSITVCPIRQWMDPFFIRGRKDDIATLFDGDSNLNELLHQLVFSIYDNETERCIKGYNVCFHTNYHCHFVPPDG